MKSRFLEMSVSVLLLLLFSLLLLWIAILIKVLGGGPILQRSVCTGYGGVPFRLISFRTLNIDASTNSCEANQRSNSFATFGAIIRRNRLDRFPELLAVLGGKLSLIGPRPVPVMAFIPILPVKRGFISPEELTLKEIG